MSDQLVPVEFRGDLIFAVKREDGIYVVAKPIAERFGLDWKSQYQRLKEDPVLSQGMVLITIPSPGGMQETTCIRLSLLNGWLFKIDPRRVKEELRADLIQYQIDCYEVLFRHFQPTAAGVEREEGALAFGANLDERDWLALIREARILGGVVAGRRMWAMAPFPPLATAKALTGVMVDPAEVRACLRHVLAALPDTISPAMAGDPDMDALLAPLGLRLLHLGLFVGNAAPVFHGSPWDGGAHRVLRVLPGVVADPMPRRLAGGQMRGIILPFDLLSTGGADE